MKLAHSTYLCIKKLEYSFELLREEVIGLRDPVFKDSSNSNSVKAAIWSGVKEVGSIVGESILDALVEAIDDATGIPLSHFVEAFKQNG